MSLHPTTLLQSVCNAHQGSAVTWLCRYQVCMLIYPFPYTLMQQGPCQPYLSPCPGGRAQCPAHGRPSYFCWLLTKHSTWKTVEYIINRGGKFLCDFFLNDLLSIHKIRPGDRVNRCIPICKATKHKSCIETIPCWAEFSLCIQTGVFRFQWPKTSVTQFLGSAEVKTQVGRVQTKVRNTFTDLGVFWIISIETSRGFLTPSNYLQVWLAF